MSEKPKRTSEIVNQEYSNCCAQLGDVIHQSEQRIKALKFKIRELSDEHRILKQIEDGKDAN